MESTHGELFYIFVDVIIFCLVMSIIFLFFDMGNRLSAEVRMQNDYNTTTTANLTPPDKEQVYEGYQSGGSTQYGETMSGQEVFNAIMSMDSSVKVKIDGVDASAINYAGGKLDWYEYARTINPSALMGIIDMDATYYVHYGITEDGTVASVQYTQ